LVKIKIKIKIKIGEPNADPKTHTASPSCILKKTNQNNIIQREKPLHAVTFGAGPLPKHLGEGCQAIVPALVANPCTHPRHSQP